MAVFALPVARGERIPCGPGRPGRVDTGPFFSDTPAPGTVAPRRPFSCVRIPGTTQAARASRPASPSRRLSEDVTSKSRQAPSTGTGGGPHAARRPPGHRHLAVAVGAESTLCVPAAGQGGIPIMAGRRSLPSARSAPPCTSVTRARRPLPGGLASRRAQGTSGAERCRGERQGADRGVRGGWGVKREGYGPFRVFRMRSTHARGLRGCNRRDACVVCHCGRRAVRRPAERVGAGGGSVCPGPRAGWRRRERHPVR